MVLKHVFAGCLCPKSLMFLNVKYYLLSLDASIQVSFQILSDAVHSSQFLLYVH